LTFRCSRRNSVCAAGCRRRSWRSGWRDCA